MGVKTLSDDLPGSWFSGNLQSRERDSGPAVSSPASQISCIASNSPLSFEVAAAEMGETLVAELLDDDGDL